MHFCYLFIQKYKINILQKLQKILDVIYLVKSWYWLYFKNDSSSKENNSIQVPNFQNTVQITVWRNINNTIVANFAFNLSNEDVGINPVIVETMIGATPLDFFSLFLDE